MKKSKSKKSKASPVSAGKLTVIAGPMFAGKTTKLLTLFSVLSNLGYSTLCFKAEAMSNGGMGHTRSHDERPLPVIYIDMKKPEKILDYVREQGIKKVIVDAIHFFPKEKFIKVVETLLAQGIDVYVNGLIYDYRRVEYGATKTLMKMADECIEQFSICVRCGGKASHTERVSGPTNLSIGTVGKVAAKYIAVCVACHRMYRG